MKQLILTLYRRPDYTARVLNALAECYGIEEYHILISHDVSEQYRDEVMAVFDVVLDWKVQHQTLKVDYVSHSPKLGIDENKLWALDRVFDDMRNDFVVCMEDDMLPAKDFLNFMEWGNREFARDTQILSVCGYNKIDSLNDNLWQLYHAYKAQAFHAWGWGMWRDRYERFFGDNAKDYRAYAGDLVNGKFDWYLSDMAKQHNLFTVKPVVPRIQNFGERNGEHTTPETFRNDHNPYGAWQMELIDTHTWLMGEGVQP